MTPDERERLLEQAYDVEQAGDLIAAARLRQLAREQPTDDEDAARAARWRAHRMRLYFPVGL